MKIIEGTISRQDLSTLAQNLYSDMIKAVTDVDKGILAIDAELPGRDIQQKVRRVDK